MEVNCNDSLTKPNCLEGLPFKKDAKPGRKISITSASEGNQSWINIMLELLMKMGWNFSTSSELNFMDKYVS